MSDLARLSQELKNLADTSTVAVLQRFFKTGKGQYGEGDVFLGIKVPVSRKIAKKYVYLGFPDISRLFKSKFHEFRLVALLILVAKYEATQDNKIKTQIFNFYLKNTKHINNWDLVDLSAARILGEYLFLNQKKRAILFRLAKSKNLWERRMAIVATYAFIQKGRAEETLELSKKLLKDKHDLIHKAVGWMLREVGKRVDRKKLLNFLEVEIKSMPRTALRYAIEHLSPSVRKYYLKK